MVDGERVVERPDMDGVGQSVGSQVGGPSISANRKNSVPACGEQASPLPAARRGVDAHSLGEPLANGIRDARKNGGGAAHSNPGAQKAVASASTMPR